MSKSKPVEIDPETGEVTWVKPHYAPPKVASKNKVLAFDSAKNGYVPAVVEETNFDSPSTAYKVKSGNKSFWTFRVLSAK